MIHSMTLFCTFEQRVVKLSQEKINTPFGALASKPKLPQTVGMLLNPRVALLLLEASLLQASGPWLAVLQLLPY